MSNDFDPAEPKTPKVSPQHENWATTLEHGIEEIRTQPAEVLFLDVLKIDLPYIIMLSTAVLGIGIVTFTGQPVALYWEFLTPVYCAICIYVGWRHTETTHERTRLVWTQVLHWAAFLFGMWLIYSPPLRQLVDVNAAGLNLMVLLAVATFVAGVHAAAWQICVVGILLGLFVPLVAIIQRSSLFIIVSILGLAFIVASIYITLHAHRRKARETEEMV
ncbi:hypothetical protein [Methylocystis sp. B8]|uniref:hypothetical protein n=1 Tax=Methylocystis sp. B8 TaxID=544938 RepID=UPI0010FD64EC|nr:hypothetical protein [Methylocystis sp. B8]TLG75055.1 hypothetical protein FEV16_11035 [Methylocystis sp. B8]